MSHKVATIPLDRQPQPIDEAELHRTLNRGRVQGLLTAVIAASSLAALLTMHDLASRDEAVLDEISSPYDLAANCVLNQTPIRRTGPASTTYEDVAIECLKDTSGEHYPSDGAVAIVLNIVTKAIKADD